MDPAYRNPRIPWPSKFCASVARSPTGKSSHPHRRQFPGATCPGQQDAQCQSNLRSTGGKRLIEFSPSAAQMALQAGSTHAAR